MRTEYAASKISAFRLRTVGRTLLPDHSQREREGFALNSEYLALCMGFYINAIKGAAKGLIPGISREDILNLILPVPSLNYQAKVAEQVAEVTNIFSAIEKSLS